jgi:hypothetical protein
VQRYDPHTYVLRQSKALSAEAPFKDKPGAHTFDDFVIMNGPDPQLHRQSPRLRDLGEDPATGVRPGAPERPRPLSRSFRAASLPQGVQ